MRLGRMTAKCTDEFAGSSVQLDNPQNHSDLCCRWIRGVKWNKGEWGEGGGFSIICLLGIQLQHKGETIK